MGVTRTQPQGRGYDGRAKGPPVGTDHPTIEVADARAKVRKNLVLVGLSQDGSEPVVAERDDPRDVERFQVVERCRAARVPRSEVQHAALRIISIGVCPVVHERHERPQRLIAVLSALALGSNRRQRFVQIAVYPGPEAGEPGARPLARHQRQCGGVRQSARMRLGEKLVDDARHVRHDERDRIGAHGKSARVAGLSSRLHLPRVVSGRQTFIPVDPVLRRGESFRVAIGIGQGYLVSHSAAQMGPAEIRRALLDLLAVTGAHCRCPGIVERGLPVQQNVHHPVGVLVRNAAQGQGLGQGRLGFVLLCTTTCGQEQRQGSCAYRDGHELTGYHDRRNTEGSTRSNPNYSETKILVAGGSRKKESPAERPRAIPERKSSSPELICEERSRLSASRSPGPQQHRR